MGNKPEQTQQNENQAQDPANRPIEPHQEAVRNAQIPSAGPRQADEPGPLEPAEPLSANPNARSEHVEAYAPLSNGDNPEASGQPGIIEVPRNASSEEIEAMADADDMPERVNQSID